MKVLSSSVGESVIQGMNSTNVGRRGIKVDVQLHHRGVRGTTAVVEGTDVMPCDPFARLTFCPKHYFARGSP